MTSPPPAPCTRRTATRVLAVAATLAVSLTTWASPAGAAGASPRDRLRAAAHGTLSSGFGTLQFRGGGRARFAVKECGFQPIRPGFVTTFTDCPPDTATGTVTATDNGYQLRRADGSVIRFTAYVDSGRQLHLGFGSIGRLAADRTGTVNVSPSEQLVVGTTGCQYVQAGAAQTIPCQFIQDAGRTILTYTAPAAVPGAGQLAGLVYLPDLRLVVSPDMVNRIYRPK